jgi:perosamine synthetase
MGLARRIALIPRYNWDYGLLDAGKALSSLALPGRSQPSALERFFGRRAVYTTSGRASLFTILKALGLPPGSGVGVPLYCCSVVFDAIAEAGLVPVFVDIDPTDYGISPEDLARKKGRLAAAVVVHMFGHPADLDGITAVAGDSIPIVEDCAQGLFSQYKGEYVGFHNAASFFSFRSGKYISSGEGSAIFCRDGNLRTIIEERVAKYEAWGPVEEAVHCASTLVKSTLYHRPWFGCIGYPVGSLLDRKLNLTAKSGFHLRKISRVDMRTIDDRVSDFQTKVDRQRENSEFLKARIRPVHVDLPVEKDGCRSNGYQFAIRFRERRQRDAVASCLWEHGVDSARYLDDIVEYATRYYGYEGDCPVSEKCSKSVLSIPVHYTLSEGHIARIAEILNDALRITGT